MDRAEVMQSPAYLAMTPSGKRVLHIIEGMTSRNGGGPNLRGLETSGRSDFRAGHLVIWNASSSHYNDSSNLSV